MLRRLDTLIPSEPGRVPPPNADEMRRVTLQVAFEPDGWTRDRATKVAQLFDGLAAGWHERMAQARTTAVGDALDRGGPFPEGRALELGSGVGLFTPTLGHVFRDLVAADLSWEMLRRAPADAPRVQADAVRLPFPDGAFAAVVLINMFLFPREVDRLLDRTGVLMWVNTHGEATPIHLTADEVERALPGPWAGVHADAGWGTWAVFRRG